jgi:serine/threonine protein kinase
LVRKIQERWKRIGNLPGGGQAFTHLVIDTTGEYPGTWVQKRLKNPARIERFKKEIKAGLELSHPNVIRVIDYVLEADRPYLVAEYCSHGTLGDADLSQLSIIERLRLFASITRGVAHAHSQKPPIIHRDIKPNNIFIREDGTPVVGDFGICFIDEGGERLTVVDEVMGPRWFVAPELEDGRTDEIGPWSDVYSLGKLLYWMIAGRIFSREKHREPKYDLTQNQWDASNFFIYALLDKTIVREPEHRLLDAGVALKEIEGIIRRILMNAHPINIRERQACTYCGIGDYQLLEAEGRYKPYVPKDSKHIGPGYQGDRDYFVLVCDHCGNVQSFRPDRTKDPDVWKPR